MNSAGKVDSKKRGKDAEDGDGPQGNKKRFVWPDYLHRDFISAVFDVGLKFVNAKELATLLPKDISQEHIRSHVQKFRNFRRRGSRSNYGSQNNLTSLNHNESSYIDSNRVPRLMVNTNNSLQGHGTTGSNNSLLEDDMSLGATEDYRNIYEIDHHSVDNSADAETAAHVQGISAELASVASTIAHQSSYIQSLSQNVMHQMKLYTALVDTLIQIDPAKAAEHIMNPSYLHNNLTKHPLGYNQGNNYSKPILGGTSIHGSNNNLAGSYPDRGPGTPIPGLRMYPSQDSFAGVNSEQIIASLKTASASPFRDNYNSTHSFSSSNNNNNNNSANNNGSENESFKGMGFPMSRTEFSAIFEMRAQMDLHRKLFERKEDQVGNYYGNMNMEIDHTVEIPNRFASHYTNNVNMNQYNPLSSYSEESYTYNQPTVQQPPMILSHLVTNNNNSNNQFNLGRMYNNANHHATEEFSNRFSNPFNVSSSSSRPQIVNNFSETNGNSNIANSSGYNNSNAVNNTSSTVAEDEFEADLFSFLINNSSPERNE